VNKSVKNGIRESGVANALMPILDGQLAGDDRGAGVIPAFNDLQKILSLSVRQRCQPKVINDQHGGSR